MDSIYFTREGPTEGSFSAPDYPHYFDFDDRRPVLVEHPSSPELRRYANNDYPYDPRLFDVGAQFLSTPSIAAAAPEAPGGGEMMALRHAYTWQQSAPNSQEQVENHASMLHPALHLRSTSTAPGVGSFEPMITAWEVQREPPSTAHTATPSPSLSSAAAQSPASSVMPAFSRKNSYNYFGQESPESAYMLPNVKVDLHFDPVSISGTRTRKKSSAKTNEPSRNETSNKKRKPGSRTTTKNSPVENNQGPSKKSSYSTRAAKDASNASIERIPPARGQTTQFLNSISSADVATEYGSPHTTATSPESQAQGSSDKLASRGGPSLVLVGGDTAATAAADAQPPSPGSQRERNRTAATKCRAKTKAGVAQLEATERTMSAQNAELSAQVMDLRGQVLALKNELLRHGNCDCQIIQRYLTSEAIRIGGREGSDR